jgi:hypothetical protein
MLVMQPLEVMLPMAEPPRRSTAHWATRFATAEVIVFFRPRRHRLTTEMLKILLQPIQRRHMACPLLKVASVSVVEKILIGRSLVTR